jgi:hypothetical protein
MERRAIDWETASVTVGERSFELAVSLDGDPSPEWRALFDEAAEKEALAPHDHALGPVRLAERALSLQALWPEAREQASGFLEGIVSRTNEVLAARIEKEERERLRQEQERAEQERTAEELASWFRSAGRATQGAGPRQIEPSDGEGGAEDRRTEGADLRDRLFHAFGSGAGA